ncbi:MAG: phosphatidate cytidylyltransferase [Clostridia bacterium]|nr:phosphatidate cytidylyltransferase [Clostridia bacterium]
MNFKRIISGLVGFPIAAVVFLFANVYVMDFVVAIIAGISLHEYMKCFKVSKKAKPIAWVSYAMCLILPLLHVIPSGYLAYTIGLLIPLIIFILFLHIIISNMKYSVKDAAVTLFGILYVIGFYAFVSRIFGMNNGKVYIWYVAFSAWGTDVFAYIIGRRFGKHKFSQISPNKSIEGCVAGVIGALVLTLAYTAILNNGFNYTINYAIIGIIAVILSIVSQVGDFSASSIKRYTGVKDFGNLIPGHGGILDRFDSFMFIAPFAFFLLMLI